MANGTLSCQNEPVPDSESLLFIGLKGKEIMVLKRKKQTGVWSFLVVPTVEMFIYSCDVEYA